MQNGGQRNCQGRDMGQRIEVCRAGSIAHPQPFLLSPENQKRFMQEVNQRLKCFGHAVTIADILQSLFRGTSCYLLPKIKL